MIVVVELWLHCCLLSVYTPGISVFSLGLYVEFHTKGIFDMESEI